MPVRARDLARALASFGVEIIESKGGGSHFKCVKGSRVYTISLHNGLKTEIANVYVKGVCRAFDIDIAELRKKL